MANHTSRGRAGTSRTAYILSRGTAKKQRTKVLKALRDEPNGFSNYELADTLGISVQSAGGRRNELMHAGKCCLAGEKRPTKNGGTAEVVVAREHASSVQVANTLTYLDSLAQRRGIAQLARDVRHELHRLYKWTSENGGISPLQKDVFRRLNTMTKKDNFK